ncbi:MAG: family 16 glycoside hydrolase [Halioglobus sp.]
MKKFIALLLALPLVLVLLVVLAVAIAMQQGVASRSDIEFLIDLGKRDGLGAVVATIRAELYGVDPADIADPSYGREQVEGRGHAPWVLRGNLDGRPRVLEFALAPGLWAAYDTQQQSLYQVWEGEVLFEGAAYDYRHGPQPVSQGAWYLRDPQGAQWFLQVNGEELPAQVQYLGHEYGSGRKTAAMRFALTAGDYRVELTEQPELVARNGTRVLTRTFQRTDELPAIKAGFRTGNGAYHLAEGTVELPLASATAIAPQAESGHGDLPAAADAAAGESVIANSDCLGCHAANHRVTGPSWSQIAGKFRGKLQDEVVTALAQKVLNGSVNTWGPVPMPAHPQLSEEQAVAAVTYILGVDEQDANLNVPLDAAGNPYAATLAYDVLPRLRSLHPSFQLENLAPPGFEPKVGGLAFRDDGKLLVASWDADGTVFLVDPAAPESQRVKRIAEGLHEPLGLSIVDNRIYVLQKQELTELIDTDGDDVIDRYRAVSYDWPSSANFHSFAFGLQRKDDDFYFLLSICVLPGGASCPEQLPTQGKLLRANDAGEVDIYASGFRTPNGIATGPNGDLYVTDNQGDWLPANKLIHVEEGAFYGSRAVPAADLLQREESPPTVWLPQDEVGNSPTQPLLLTEGPYAGQMIHGDVYNGGIKRVFLEDVNGQQQGAAFHFSAGFQGAVNRLVRGPDGAIYIGEIGNPPNWGEYGKPWFGLERIQWVGNNAFEILSVKAQHDGFVIELTQPLAADMALTPADIVAKQWFYYPNEQYGGPKYDETVLPVTGVEVAADRRSVHLHIPGLKAGYVVYLRLNDRLRSTDDQTLWTAEAWYTLNAIPQPPADAPATASPATSVSSGDGWRDLFDGKSLAGWRNYGGDENAVRKWTVQDGTLALVQDGVFPMWDMIKSAVFGGPGGDLVYYREKFRDFELSLQWKISRGGNSGIFYLVKDETENVSWRTGIEMQVLDNDEHPDGKIITHRAGDLYDLIAANPETVRPPGEWNDVLIRVKDNHIEHWLNGVKVVSVERGSDQWNALVAASKFSDMPGYGKADAGYIALQDHGDPVWFRNIRVREL